MIKTLVKIINVPKEYHKWMLLAALVGFFTVGSSIGLMMTSAYIISKAALQVEIHEIQVAIVGVRFFGIARGAFRYLERLISHEVTFKLLAKFRVWFFRKLEPVAPSQTVDFTSGDLLSRSVEDIEKLEHLFVRVVSPPIVLIFILFLMWFLLGIFNFLYSLIFAFVYLTAAIGVPLLTYVLSKNIGQKTVLLKSRLSELIIDGIQGLNELLSFSAEEEWKEKVKTIEKKLLALERKMKIIEGLHESLIGLMMNIAVFTISVAAVPAVHNGLLQGFYLAVIIIGVMAAFEAVFPIPQSVQYLEQTAQAGRRLLEITEMQPSVSTKGKEEIELTKFDLAIENLSFNYSEEKSALKNLSMNIPFQSKVAIVGATGAGKSTLVNLLTKLWDYNAGTIKIGGIDYSEIPQEKIRKVISVVPQKVSLFTGTLKENLLIANPNATEEELWQALEKAELKNFADSLPGKLNAPIGEAGNMLSGGERKRLAIARALLKNSPIIICDEITSDLDAITERNIIRTLLNISTGKTVIFITHRLIELEKFDNIFVLLNGEIVEQGEVKTLKSGSNYFNKLLASQNQLLEEG